MAVVRKTNKIPMIHCLKKQGWQSGTHASAVTNVLSNAVKREKALLTTSKINKLKWLQEDPLVGIQSRGGGSTEESDVREIWWTPAGCCEPSCDDSSLQRHTGRHQSPSEKESPKRTRACG
jgi:hypothetical protein